MSYIEIPILEAARRVGLHLRPRTLAHVEVLAHCPFCEDTHFHLSLNTRKNMYRCNRCKTSGNSVSLYAKLMHMDNATAYHELAEGNLYAIQPAPRPKQPDEQEPQPLHIRHDVYYEFLSLLELSGEHRQNLLARGLSEERIARNMYRSVPAGGVREILDALSEKCDFMGIPGFYTADGIWAMYQKPGFFIPVCTPEGYIQGLQIRLDGGEHHKYRWFSSRYEENGTRAYSWIHVTGKTSNTTACVTEGALKADVASSLSQDALFVAVPGINCLNGLPDVLKSMGIRKVVETFDMDKHRNPYVAKAVADIRGIVLNLGLEYQSYNWNSSYKGIDEYLLSRAVG